MPFADPRWLLAVTADGLAAVGPTREVEVGIEAGDRQREALLAALTGGDAAVAPTEPASRPLESQARELRARLLEAGAMTQAEPESGRLDGTRLADAVLAVERGGGAGDRRVWTADELLLLPRDAERAATRRALRAFIAGMSDDLRLRSYAYLASRLRATVRGDLPDPARAAAALEGARELDPEAVHVIALADDAVHSVAADRLGELGAAIVHRLGTVTAERVEGREDGSFVAVAHHAVPNLHWPLRHAARIGRGVAGEPAQARRIACAEAAERYATGDAGAHSLRRAGESALDGAVSPSSVYRFNARQARSLPAPPEPDAELLWVRAATLGGEARWLPAELVFAPFADPDPDARLPQHASSSGAAAHVDRQAAIENSFAELVERDAFMWTWVQRVSRELIDPGSLPADLRERRDAVLREGCELHLVNLTLDTLAVAMAVLLKESWIVVATAAHRHPRAAVGKCIVDVASLGADAARRLPWERERLTARDVRSPRDHLRFHHDADLRGYDEFLFGSGDRIALEEIESVDAPATEAVSEVAEPLVAELSSPASAPFVVVRAVAPGLVPVGFGYDREPLGMQRLAHPLKTGDGRSLGSNLDLSEAGPLIPHPFA